MLEKTPTCGGVRPIAGGRGRITVGALCVTLAPPAVTLLLAATRIGSATVASDLLVGLRIATV
jgi:hypothetical protein